ncbi:MAG: ProQ/FINO family protein [Arsenophonus sp.]
MVSRLIKDYVISKTKLRSALLMYTSSLCCIYSVKEGVNRIDLYHNNYSDIESRYIDYTRQQS